MVIKKCPKCGGTVVYSPVCRGNVCIRKAVCTECGYSE